MYLFVFLQVVNSEWVLGVHVQHFQNLYNAEFRDSRCYCCCDIPSIVVPCVEELINLTVLACTSECEPFIEIRFEVSFANGTYLYTKNKIACTSDILGTCLSPLLVQLHPNESIIDNVDIINVSAKKAFLLFEYEFK